MLTPLVIVGLLVAAFVGFNIGGSSTGVAFGPAVGSKIVRVTTAGALFTLCLGCRVVPAISRFALTWFTCFQPPTRLCRLRHQSAVWSSRRQGASFPLEVADPSLQLSPLLS